MITTTLDPKDKKDIIGVAIYYPEDGTIFLHCCEGRNWEKTKDFTGLTESIYKHSVKTESCFREIMLNLRDTPLATFSYSICQKAFKIYGIKQDYLIGIPSAVSAANNSFIEWESFEENPNIIEWIALLNKQKIQISRKDLADQIGAAKPDHRMYGTLCLDNLELDAAIWEKALKTPC